MDIAVLNAGIYQPVNAAEFDLSAYNRHMAVNYTGILHCLDGLIPAMIGRKPGISPLWRRWRAIAAAILLPTLARTVQNLRIVYFDLAPKGIKYSLSIRALWKQKLQR